MNLTKHGIRLLAREKLSYLAHTKKLKNASSFQANIIASESILHLLCIVKQFVQNSGMASESFSVLCQLPKGVCGWGWSQCVASSVWQQPLLQGVPGQVLLLCPSHPSVLLPYFTPPQINSYWQESRSALQKESQTMKWPGPCSLGSSPAWNLSHSLISWCAVLLMAGELCPFSQKSTLFSRSAAVILIYRGGSQAAFFHDSGFIVWTIVFFLVS